MHTLPKFSKVQIKKKLFRYVYISKTFFNPVIFATEDEACGFIFLEFLAIFEVFEN